VQGKSRAATFILAYLIGKEKMAEYDLEILSKY
jgi:hypothetical protein